MGNTFWSTREGKILSHGIHDHNNGSAIINSYIKELIRKIEKGEEIDKDEMLKVLYSIDKARLRCRDSIDYIYNNIKEIYNENESR